jgi:hypothetical protein
MKSFQRPKTVAELGVRIIEGADAGMELKDFLHEFQENSSPTTLEASPPTLAGRVEKGQILDAYLQALAVYLAAELNSDPPAWTRPPIQLPDPWFASPGAAIRNYLLISSPAPFRTRNLFIDEDSLHVV